MKKVAISLEQFLHELWTSEFLEQSKAFSKKKNPFRITKPEKKRNVDIVNQDKRITIIQIAYHVKLEVFTASEGCVRYTEKLCKHIYLIFIFKHQFLLFFFN